VVIDEDPGVIRRLDAEGIPFVEGDAGSPEVLAQANLRNARVVLASSGRAGGLQELLRQTRGSGSLVVIRIFDPVESQLVRQYEGAVAVDTVEATVEAFERWLEKC